MDTIDQIDFEWEDEYMLRGKCALKITNPDMQPTIGEHVLIEGVERKVTNICHDMTQGKSRIFLS